MKPARGKCPQCKEMILVDLDSPEVRCPYCKALIKRKEKSAEVITPPQPMQDNVAAAAQDQAVNMAAPLAESSASVQDSINGDNIPAIDTNIPSSNIETATAFTGDVDINNNQSSEVAGAEKTVAEGAITAKDETISDEDIAAMDVGEGISTEDIAAMDVGASIAAEDVAAMDVSVGANGEAVDAAADDMSALLSDINQNSTFSYSNNADTRMDGNLADADIDVQASIPVEEDAVPEETEMSDGAVQVADNSTELGEDIVNNEIDLGIMPQSDSRSVETSKNTSIATPQEAEAPGDSPYEPKDFVNDYADIYGAFDNDFCDLPQRSSEVSSENKGVFISAKSLQPETAAKKVKKPKTQAESGGALMSKGVAVILIILSALYVIFRMAYGAYIDNAAAFTTLYKSGIGYGEALQGSLATMNEFLKVLPASWSSLVIQYLPTFGGSAFCTFLLLIDGALLFLICILGITSKKGKVGFSLALIASLLYMMLRLWEINAYSFYFIPYDISALLEKYFNYTFIVVYGMVMLSSLFLMLAFCGSKEDFGIKTSLGMPSLVWIVIVFLACLAMIVKADRISISLFRYAVIGVWGVTLLLMLIGINKPTSSRSGNSWLFAMSYLLMALMFACITAGKFLGKGGALDNLEWMMNCTMPALPIFTIIGWAASDMRCR